MAGDGDQQQQQLTDELERRAGELAQQRLLLNENLATAWERVLNLRQAIRDVVARQRAVDNEMRARGQ